MVVSTARTHSRSRRRRRRGERGSVTVELVVAVPLLLLMLLFIAQAAVWMHATHVAQSAATRGLDAARAESGTTTDGQAAAETTIDAVGRRVLVGPRVSVIRGTATVRVRIDATALSVMPGVHWPIQVTAAGPVERFVPDTEDR